MYAGFMRSVSCAVYHVRCIMRGDLPRVRYVGFANPNTRPRGFEAFEAAETDTVVHTAPRATGRRPTLPPYSLNSGLRFSTPPDCAPGRRSRM